MEATINRTSSQPMSGFSTQNLQQTVKGHIGNGVFVKYEFLSGVHHIHVNMEGQNRSLVFPNRGLALEFMDKIKGYGNIKNSLR